MMDDRLLPRPTSEESFSERMLAVNLCLQRPLDQGQPPPCYGADGFGVYLYVGEEKGQAESKRGLASFCGGEIAGKLGTVQIATSWNVPCNIYIWSLQYSIEI